MKSMICFGDSKQCDLVVIIRGLGAELPNHRIAGSYARAASGHTAEPRERHVVRRRHQMALMLFSIGSNWVRFAKNGAFVLVVSYP
jgi:hypothetical protein